MSVSLKKSPFVTTTLPASRKKSTESDENENTLVATDSQRLIADFENDKLALINKGKMAANNLFLDGKFDETDKICDTVLSLDPEDIEISDLKEQAEYFHKNPSEFDRSKIQFIKDDNDISSGGRRSGGGRLFRSVSERARKRFQQKVQVFKNGQASQPSNLIDDSEEVFTMNGNSSAAVAEGDIPKRQGLMRTQSESGKTGSSVSQKIQSFEQLRKTFGGKIANGKPPTVPRSVSTGGVSATPISSSKGVNGIPPQTPIENTSPPSAAKITGTPRRHGPTSQLGKLIKQERFDDSLPLPDSPTYNFSKKVEVIWTPAGKKEFPDVTQAELEQLFFSSEILTSACFTNLKGELLGYTKNCAVTKAELVTLITGMSKREYITSSKVTLGGKEYSCLSGTAHIVRARTGNDGINCTIFDGTMAIGFYSHPVLPKQVGQLMSSIGKTTLV